LGAGSAFTFLDELIVKALVKDELDLFKKLWGLLSSFVLAAEAEVLLDRAPASREEDLGCLTAVSFPL
jgi:hypothetical protein